MRLLTIDVGNTRLKWAYTLCERDSSQVLAQGAQFLENIECLAEQDWAGLHPPDQVLGCIVAGDGVRQRVQTQLEVWGLTALWVVPSEREGRLRNGYDHPARLGADRWVAMVGAQRYMRLHGEERPCVVVMVGTAVTVEAIDEQGHYLGGFILPGHGMMLRALESGTAGLRVPTGHVVDFPTNTSDALTTGGTYAIAGAVARMMENLYRRTGLEPLCLMTGGAGWKMMPAMSVPVELVESLIFDGLLEIAQGRWCPHHPTQIQTQAA